MDEPRTYRTLNDGCDGDSKGLAKALGQAFIVLYENFADEEGFGHHSADALFMTADGKFLHAECGGCSCGGSGSWDTYETFKEVLWRIPEYRRPSVEEIVAKLGPNAQLGH